MYYSNETRVSNTASPTSFVVAAQEPNVTQYGWTKSDTQAYNQLIQYVDEVNKVKEFVAQVYSYVLDTRRYVEDSMSRLDQFHLDYDQFKIEYKDFLVKWADAIELISFVGLAYSDVLEKFGEIVNMYDYVIVSVAHIDERSAFVDQRAIDADNSANDANDSYIKCFDLYTDLKEGQVYRGIWNPNSGSYPDPAGTNSVWDVVLNDGQAEKVFDGKTFRSGDRLLYIKASTEYQLLATGSGVTSVNGMNGAITITTDTVNAVNRSGSTMTGGLTSPTLNATGAASAQGLTFNGKTAIGGANDTWLRLNPHNQFTSGVYVNGLARVSNTLEVGPIGSTAAHTLKADGTWSHSGSGSIGGDITSNLNVLGNITEKGARVFSDNYVQPEIPFPDVWIPFNDGLQMLAGYGDEVKVDNWVVAKMASFSRASQATYIDKSGVLRTADIDEPRFEKEGLLIEGASTNLLAYSEYCKGRDSTVLSPTDGWYSMTQANASSGSTTYGVLFPSNSSTAWPVNTNVTLSIYAKGTGRVILETSIYAAFTAGVITVFDLDTVSVVSGTGQIAKIGDMFRLSIQAVTASTASTSMNKGLYVNRVDDNNDILINYAQIEPLPFATSYIPTSGAAATRTMDVCYIQWENNLPKLMTGLPATISLDIDTSYTSAYDSHRCILNQTGSVGGNVILRLNRNEDRMAFYRGGSSSTILGSLAGMDKTTKVVVSWDESDLTKMYVNGVSCGSGVRAPATVGIPPRLAIGSSTTAYGMFGHIRNFRIWHKALSDTQLKAITS